jgi:hypothetical protein
MFERAGSSFPVLRRVCRQALRAGRGATINWAAPALPAKHPFSILPQLFS